MGISNPEAAKKQKIHISLKILKSPTDEKVFLWTPPNRRPLWAQYQPITLANLGLSSYCTNLLAERRHITPDAEGSACVAEVV